MLLILVVLILVFGLGGPFWAGPRYGPNFGYGGGILGVILLIVLILFLVRVI